MSTPTPGQGTAQPSTPSGPSTGGSFTVRNVHITSADGGKGKKAPKALGYTPSQSQRQPKAPKSQGGRKHGR